MSQTIANVSFEIIPDGASLILLVSVADKRFELYMSREELSELGSYLQEQASAWTPAFPPIAQNDPELIEWLLGVVNGKPTRSGDFLRSIADAALRAGHENYPLLRPALLGLWKKFPDYRDTDKSFPPAP